MKKLSNNLIYIFILGLTSLPSISMEEIFETIPAEQLMVPKSQLMNDRWGNGQQSQWGKLSYALIEIAANKYAHGEFKTLQELYGFLAQGRSLIGLILNHNTDMGKDRDNWAETPILDKEHYSDQIHDFENMWNITAQKTLKNTTYPIELQHILNNQIIYRSQIYYHKKGDFIIKHTSPRYFADLWMIINDIGHKLSYDKNISNLSLSKKEEIRNEINQIYFYTADAMFSARGSASISQMLYHVLEKHHLGSYSYLGASRSSYGFNSGLQPDLLAMVAPDFAAFNEYFTNNIINYNAHVRVLPNTLSSHIDTLASQQNLKDLYKAFGNYKNANDNSSLEDMGHSHLACLHEEYRDEPLKLFTKNLDYLISINEEPNSHVALLINSYLNTLWNNKSFYPHFFYTTDITKNSLSFLHEPNKNMIPQFSNLQKEKEGLHSLIVLTKNMYEILQPLGQLYGVHATPHYRVHYAAGSIREIAQIMLNNLSSLSFENKLACYFLILVQQKEAFIPITHEFMTIIKLLFDNKEDQETSLENVLTYIKNNHPINKIAYLNEVKELCKNLQQETDWDLTMKNAQLFFK